MLKSIKKLLLIIVIIYISGCHDERSVIINNYSTQTIQGILKTHNSDREFKIRPDEQFLYMLTEGMKHSMVSFTSSPKQNSVFYTMEDSNTYAFFDNPVPPPPEPEPDPEPSQVFILNTLNKSVILSADGALSEDPLTIPALGERTDIFIIKRNPVFHARTVDNGYPVQVDIIIYETEQNAEGEEVTVEYRITLR